MVGHSQIPKKLEVENTEIRIFRAPGGRADDFHNDARMNEVLNWEHDLYILLIGSNDFDQESQPKDIAENISQIVKSIEQDCEAVVWVCLIEPRFYPNEEFMDHQDYRKVQRTIYKKIAKPPTQSANPFQQ